MPARLGTDALAIDKLHQTASVLDIAGLHRGDENGIDARHRDDTDLAGERAVGFCQQDLLQFSRDFAGYARRYGQ